MIYGSMCERHISHPVDSGFDSRRENGAIQPATAGGGLRPRVTDSWDSMLESPSRELAESRYGFNCRRQPVQTVSPE